LTKTCREINCRPERRQANVNASAELDRHGSLSLNLTPPPLPPPPLSLAKRGAAQEGRVERCRRPCLLANRAIDWGCHQRRHGSCPPNLYPTPWTLHPTPYSLFPTPYTLLPPRSLLPESYNPYPAPYTLHVITAVIIPLR